MNRILITGADGFIGTRLTNHLAGVRNNEIIALVLDRRNAGLLKHRRIKIVSADISNADRIKKIIVKFKPQIIYHLAGRRFSGTGSREGIYRVNAAGTLNLLLALVNIKIKRLVFASTADVYGRVKAPYKEDGPIGPLSDYGASKYLAELAINRFNLCLGLPAVILRFSVVYGPGQSEGMFIPKLIGLTRRKEIIPVTAGEQTRDFVYIEDALNAFVLAANSRRAIGHTINIASGCSVKIKSAARKITDLTGTAVYLKIGRIPYRKDEVFDYRLSITKAKRLLGWQPKVGFREGIKKILEE